MDLKIKLFRVLQLQLMLMVVVLEHPTPELSSGSTRPSTTPAFEPSFGPNQIREPPDLVWCPPTALIHKIHLIRAYGANVYLTCLSLKVISQAEAIEQHNNEILSM